MLESFTKMREARAQQKALELFHKGCQQLDGKLYKQALIDFQEALETDPKTMPDQFRELFESYAQSGDHEATLSVGMVLLTTNKTDYQLANKLGNCARKQKNFKQANNFYRHALKINKNFELAFFNLAASMGKVEKYDEDVKSAIDKFNEVKEYILPDFCNNPEILNEITNTLTDANKKRNTELIQTLTIEKEQKELEGNDRKVLELEKKIKILQEKSSAPDKEQITGELTKRYMDSERDLSKDDKNAEKVRYGNLFNLGLYALSQEDLSTAEDTFIMLRDKKSGVDYVNMCLALVKELKGDREGAINQMIRLLGEEQYNRYYNVNLALMYRKAGKRLLAYKYFTVAAALLERSDGYYKLSDLQRVADQYYEKGFYKKVIQIYKVIVSETTDSRAWDRLGISYMKINKYKEATDAYKRLLRIDPESVIAKNQLQNIHDHYVSMASDFFDNNKYQAAAGMYEKALKIIRNIDTLRRTISVYNVLRDKKRLTELTKEHDKMVEEQKEAEKERARQDYITRGKLFLKKRNYIKAIENFELAFRMKLDKDVFMYLATIFKSLKRNNDMKELLVRWNNMVEYEDRMRKFKKDEERAQKG